MHSNTEYKCTPTRHPGEESAPNNETCHRVSIRVFVKLNVSFALEQSLTSVTECEFIVVFELNDWFS